MPSLFVAVVPPVDVIEHLHDTVADVRHRLRAPDLRWTAPDRWHITIAYLGEPPEPVDETVADHLTSLTEDPAVRGVRLSGSGSFGGSVLWTGVEEGPARDQRAALARTIPALVRGSGAIPDRRAWRPHLTVARVRGRDRQGVLNSHSAALSGYQGLHWDVTDLRLIRSSGGPRPVHEVVATFPLR